MGETKPYGNNFKVVAHHKLKGNQPHNLRLITQFIIGAYLPNWLSAKVMSLSTDDPRHVLFQINLLRSPSKKVIQIVGQNTRSFWCVHPEAVLLAMFYTKDEKQRIVVIMNSY